MQPSSILSYYPNYEILDDILAHGSFDTLNIFMDLKNNLQALYMQHAIINLVENTIRSKKYDTSIVSSIISFLAFHKLYAIKRKIDVNFYIFFETGRSYYHLNVSKKYKISRKIDKMPGIDKDKRDIFHQIVNKNLGLSERIFNRTPNSKVIHLKNLEADFIPYYLIKNRLVDTNPNVAQVVYSSDHDLLQCITAGENVFVYRKLGKKRRIAKKGDAVKEYLKFDIVPIPDEHYPLLMAVIGDQGDDVDGVRDIGPKRAAAIIEELVELVGGMENLYENVLEGNAIFSTPSEKIKNKFTKSVVESEEKYKTVSNNLKLVSFEILSRVFHTPKNTEIIKKREYVESVMENNEIVPEEPMTEALFKTGVLIDDELSTIYFDRRRKQGDLDQVEL